MARTTEQVMRMQSADDLSPRQETVWQVMSIVETVGICLVVASQADIGDPVVAIVTAASALAAAFFTRKWIRSRVPR